MQPILAATDFSRRADAAVRRAGLLAREHAAELVVCHVVDDDQPEALREAAVRAASAALGELVETVSELQGIRCATPVALGSPFDGIIRTAAATAAGLIVLGAHRRQLLQDMFMGTTAERVMRIGPLPVLLVNREPSRPYRRVLAAVDLSAWSRNAVESARRLGFLAGAELTILHACDAGTTTLLAAGVSAETLRENASEAASIAAKELAGFAGTIDLEGVAYATRVREGPPIRTILAATEDLDADLVVIGTRGSSGLAGLLLGSVAAELIRELDRDVLAVPALRPAAAPTEIG
ncbi:MAG: universal stress protein [Hyphomicrobiaceae bacterium]|nr:universal stress protein [Hyphomicrobiaceae bacterium]